MSGEPWRIRRGRASDAAAMLALEAQFPSDRLSAASVRHFLRAPSIQIWVAEEGARMLGNLALFTRRATRVARIYSVVVAPEARGRGLGRALVRKAEAAARAAGYQAMSLEVRADNAAARALYAGLGYREIAGLPGYYDDGATGLRLRRELAGP